MPLQTTTETEWVEIFPVWTVGVALEVFDLWQDSAFCKELTKITKASQFSLFVRDTVLTILSDPIENCYSIVSKIV